LCELGIFFDLRLAKTEGFILLCVTSQGNPSDTYQITCGPTPMNRPFQRSGLTVHECAFFHFKYHNMKRVLVILALMITTAAFMTSCSASKASAKGGCKATQGMIGYR
jgi:hypothetical protein